MGKVTAESNNSKLSKMRTQTTIKPKAMKPVVKVTVKRLTNLKRRLNDLLLERCSWEAKNKLLSNSLRDEKLNNAALHKELFESRKLYHEAMVSLNSYKMRQQDIRKTLSAYQLENNPFPHLVAISQLLTNHKLRFDKLNTLLSSVDQNSVSPSKKIDVSSSVNYYHNRSNKSTEPVGRVGPRVKGLLISKPQIMLERVMLPHTNDPDPDNQEAIADTSTEEHNIPLSPIQEEQQDEEIALRQISYRKKKPSKLGKGIRRDKSTEGNHDSQIPFDLSNISASNSPLLNRMEPVARLRDVSRLLHNSSLIQMDSGQLENAENSSTLQEREGTLFRNSHGHMSSDDPLEGCSWMNDQKYRSSVIKSRFTHTIPSDSSDDDDLDCAPAKKHTTPCTSPLPYPLMNSTANSSCQMRVVSMGVGSNSSDAFNSSPNAEPDSTSQTNLEDYSSKFNLSPSINKQTDSNSISAEYSFLNRNSLQQRKKSNAHNQLMHIDGVAISINCQVRGDFQTTEALGKRKRKPKNHAYPGEGDISPKKGKLSSGRLSVGKNTTQEKVSIGRKSLGKMSVQKRTSTGTKVSLKSRKSCDNKPSKQLKQSRKSLSKENTDVMKDSRSSSKLTQENPENIKSSAVTKVSLKSRKACDNKPSIQGKQSQRSLNKENADNMKDSKRSKISQENLDNIKSSKTKQRQSSKRSQIITPRNSECNIYSNESVREIDDNSGIRSRRNKSKISYKESPLNVKLRRN